MPNDPEVILAKEEADTALTYRSAFTIFMLILVSVSAETFFGRPVVTLEDPPVVNCIKIEHDATRRPRLHFNATASVTIEQPPTFEREQTTAVSIYFIFVSALDQRGVVTFPSQEYSGSNMQFNGTSGGAVMYGVRHSVHYGAVVSDDSTNLLAYDISQGEFQLLGIVNITFGAGRHYTYRKEIRFQTFGNFTLWELGCAA